MEENSNTSAEEFATPIMEDSDSSEEVDSNATTEVCSSASEEEATLVKDGKPKLWKVPVDFFCYRAWEASKANPPCHPYPMVKPRFDVVENWLVVKDVNGELDSCERCDMLMSNYLRQAESGILKALVSLPKEDLLGCEVRLRKLLFQIGQCWEVHGIHRFVPGALPWMSTPLPSAIVVVGLPYHLRILSPDVIYSCLLEVYHCLIRREGPAVSQDSGPFGHRRFSYAIRRIGIVVAKLKATLFQMAFQNDFGGHPIYPLVDRFGRFQKVNTEALSRKATAYRHELSILSSVVPRWVVADLVARLNLEIRP